MYTEKIKKILITKDHDIASQQLHTLIIQNFPDCIIDNALSPNEMQANLDKGNFTHMILDLNPGDDDTMEAIPILAAKYPQLMILVYSVAPQEAYARKLLHLGASGFLSKRASEKEHLRTLDIFLLLSKN